MSASFYGAFDKGKYWEWNEAVIGSSNRGLRGGSWLNNSSSLAAWDRGDGFPSHRSNRVGFRVATVPEPSTGLLGALGMLGKLNAAETEGQANLLSSSSPLPLLLTTGDKRF